MSQIDHFEKLKNMYLSAEINQKLYPGTEIHILEGIAEISMDLKPDFHHALKALHGSVYFKLLDDAAFFAVQSLVQTHFVLTSNFQINFLKSLRSGRVIAKGSLKFQSRNLFFAQASLFDSTGKELAFGTGSFVKSEVELSQKIGYKL